MCTTYRLDVQEHPLAAAIGLDETEAAFIVPFDQTALVAHGVVSVGAYGGAPDWAECSARIASASARIRASNLP